jgi:hypothetical protein
MACDKPGNGRCSDCFGTGQNIHLNSSVPECRLCGGSGTCQRCGGTGTIEVEGSGWMPDFLERLFSRWRK